MQRQQAAPLGQLQPSLPPVQPRLTAWDFWLDITGTTTAGATGILFLVDTINRLSSIISQSPIVDGWITGGAFVTLIATGIIVLIL